MRASRDEFLPWSQRSLEALGSKRKVIVATIAITSIPKDGVPIATKVIQRAQDKNKLTPGTNHANRFTVLNCISNNMLKKVLVDPDIDTEDIDSQLDLFKA